MLKIRLQRVGRINMPAYRVIVTEHTRGPKTGNFVEKVGNYNPKTKEQSLDTDRIKYWVSQGAQPSGTMRNMLITAGVITGKKINVLPKKTFVKKIESVVETAPEVAPTEVVAEEPLAEAPIEEFVEASAEEVSTTE